MKSKILLILLIGLILRVYMLASLPALNADEAAIGYNAYSMIETGNDEFGTSWPLVFRSFDDYKPGIYFYLVMPFVWILGLNVWAVRLPAVIMSLLSIWGVYMLVKEGLSQQILLKGTLTSMIGIVGRKKKDFQNMLNTADWLGLTAAFCLAIMPWHIHFSRGGWETQVATSMLVLGSWCLWKGLRSERWLYVGVALYVISLYTYHSMRIVVPLLGISFVIIHRDFFEKYKKKAGVSLGLVLLLLIPFVMQLFSEVGLSRAQGVSIFADSGPFWRANELRAYHEGNNLFIRLIHNRYVQYAITFGENYLSHFNGNFLFISGDEIQRNKVPNFGQLYLIWIPFLVLGIIQLIKRNSKINLFLMTWLLISPIPAALTFQSPHAVRAFSITIPLAVIVGMGLVTWVSFLFSKFSHRYSKIVGITALGLILVWGLGRYVINYYRLMMPTYPYSSQYGFEELVPWVESRIDDYDLVWVTDRYDQPYILFLFYSKYPPKAFQSEAEVVSSDFGFGTVREYHKYRFASVDWEQLKEENEGKRVLVIGTEEEIPESVGILKRIEIDRGPVVVEVAEL